MSGGSESLIAARFAPCEGCTSPFACGVPETCRRATAMEARADELVEYGNSLPDGVTTEAFAEAANLRREAANLRG